MLEVLPPWPLLSVFLVASLALAVTPGPGVLYIVARSLAQGRRGGLASVAGVAAGNLGNALAASAGLAALFAVSATAFVVVKYAGAAYLVFLGLRAFGGEAAGTRPAPIERVAVARVFRDGALVALLNPKTTLFFAAFLPQFVVEVGRGDPMLRTATLATLFVAIAAVTDSLYAIAAGALAPVLGRARGARRAGRYASGSALIGLGIYTAVSGSRAK